MYLYIDTTFNLVVGLLDKEFNFIHYIHIEENKSSRTIHSEIYKILNEVGINAKDVLGIFTCAGPGSYTGMRVGEGIAQIFKLEGIENFSFYHFEVPKILGYSCGVWYSNAFKGETFCYSWDQNSSQYTLDKNMDLFINNYEHKFNVHQTSQMIKENSATFFKFILLEKMQRTLYYYRSIANEFKKGKS